MVALVASLLAVVLAAPAASAATVSIEQTQSTGNNRFQYSSGDWFDCGSCLPAGSSGGTYKYTTAAGAVTALYFTGTKARIYGVKESNGGTATVSIDGVTVSGANPSWAGSGVANQLIYETPTLSAGTHVLRLFRSSGKLTIDRAEVDDGQPTAGTWLSGGGDGSTTSVADGSFGTWRGDPADTCSTWSDTDVNNQTNAWQFNNVVGPPGGAYKDWTGSCDWAPGAIFSGESWAAAATGAYDARWRTALENVETLWKRIPRGPLYIRFAHEMNGNWYPWAVKSSEVTAFKQAWARFRAIQQDVFPESKLVFSTNANTVQSPYYDWRTLWPGDSQVDVYSVDFYSQHYGSYTLGNTTDGTGAPTGLEAHRLFAQAHGKQLVISEWGVNGGDNQNGNANFGPQYVQAMHDFFVDHAGTGAGELVYENYFNTGSQFAVFINGGNNSNKPLSAQKYKDLF